MSPSRKSDILMIPDWLFRVSKPALLLLTLSVVPIAFSQQLPISVSAPRISNGKYAPDRILVKFRQGMSAQARANVHSGVGAHTLKQYTAVRDLETVSLPAGLDLGAALRAYRQRPEIEYAEPDYIIHTSASPNDPLFPQMWNLLNSGQNGGTTGDDVGATLAWNLSTGDHTVIVATIDSGIDFTHPDLIPNLFHDTAVCNGVNDGANG